MQTKGRFQNSILGPRWSSATAALNVMTVLLFLTFLMLFLTLTAATAQGQSYKVLHHFTSREDGGGPGALIIDRAGNLYGTTGDGAGYCGGVPCGTVFQLSRKGSGWVLTTLYAFSGNEDGAIPTGLAFGPDGDLYGTTEFGGGSQQNCCGGCGTVFKLRPPATACRAATCRWSETILHRFNGTDGDQPLGRSLAFDQAGNLYGTAFYGGAGACFRGCYPGCGVVWELTRAGDGWTASVPHTFNGYDGASPVTGVAIDQSGNLYGTTPSGGDYGSGTVFQLARGGDAWSLNVLYNFPSVGDGFGPYPASTLVFDGSNNLYGATVAGGSRDGGMVFNLDSSSGMWLFTELYGFEGPYYPYSGPNGNLVMDNQGNLYGATSREGGTGCGGYGCGTIFKLTPGLAGWTYTVLHAFNDADGNSPFGLALDSAGNLYGTTAVGGIWGRGVVFQITP